MLFTGKGDDGSTSDFRSKKRHSKYSLKSETLGSFDELNSFLGVCKVKAGHSFGTKEIKIQNTIAQIQENIFIIQAEIAGADKSIFQDEVERTENLINSIEKIIPPIKTFSISGGTELSALLDTARAMARRAERRLVGFHQNEGEIDEWTRKYANRLSSLLFALARLTNHLSGIKESSPNY